MRPETLQRVHAFTAPRAVRQLAKKFDGPRETYSPNFHLERARRAGSAPEAAHHAMHAGIDRASMRRLVAPFVMEEATTTKQLVTASLQTKTQEASALAGYYAEAYTGLMRRFHALHTPDVIAQAIDTATRFLPSATNG